MNEDKVWMIAALFNVIVFSWIISTISTHWIVYAMLAINVIAALWFSYQLINNL